MKNKILICIIIVLIIICGLIGFYRNSIKNRINDVKILVEKHQYVTGMPGPNGESNKGTSEFIASDGFIYLFTYDEYDKFSAKYPKEKSINQISKKLLSKAKKTDKRVTDEELEQLKENIKNIEENERIDEKTGITSTETNEPTLADSEKKENIVIYDYFNERAIQIGINNATFFDSQSIQRIRGLVGKYLNE